MQTQAENKYLVSSHDLLQHIFIANFIHVVQLLHLKTKQTSYERHLQGFSTTDQATCSEPRRQNVVMY